MFILTASGAILVTLTLASLRLRKYLIANANAMLPQLPAPTIAPATIPTTCEVR